MKITLLRFDCTLEKKLRISTCSTAISKSGQQDSRNVRLRETDWDETYGFESLVYVPRLAVFLSFFFSSIAIQFVSFRGVPYPVRFQPPNDHPLSHSLTKHSWAESHLLILSHSLINHSRAGTWARSAVCENSSVRLGSLGSARLRSVPLGSARLRSAPLGSGRLGSARVGSGRSARVRCVLFYSVYT